jgi:hypothetical protein
MFVTPNMGQRQSRLGNRASQPEVIVKTASKERGGVLRRGRGRDYVERYARNGDCRSSRDPRQRRHFMAQDKSSSLFFDMPVGAIDQGKAELVLSPARIAEALILLAEQWEQSVHSQ